LHPDENLAIHIPCGCSESDSQIVVTYTVQPNDTPTLIANLLNASLADMLSMNKILDPNFKFIDVGWVLFVPKGSKGLLPSTAAGNEGWLSASSSARFFLYKLFAKFVSEITI